MSIANIDIPTESTLSTIAISQFQQDDKFIAERVMPTNIVGTKSYDWLEYNSQLGFVRTDTEYADGADLREFNTGAKKRSGIVKNYGVRAFISKGQIPELENGRFGNQRETFFRQTIKGLTSQLMIDREYLVHKEMAKSSNYAFSKDVASTRLDNDSTNTLRLLLKEMERPLRRPNLCVMSSEVWTKLRTNPSLVSAVLGNSGTKGAIEQEQFANLLELGQNGGRPRVLLADARQSTLAYSDGDNFDINSATTIATISRIFGNQIMFIWVDDNPNEPTWAWTARQVNAAAGYARGINVDMLELKEKSGSGTYQIRAIWAYNHQIVSKGSGLIILNATTPNP